MAIGKLFAIELEFLQRCLACVRSEALVNKTPPTSQKSALISAQKFPPAVHFGFNAALMPPTALRSLFNRTIRGFPDSHLIAMPVDAGVRVIVASQTR